MNEFKINISKAYNDYFEVAEELEANFLSEVIAKNGFQYNIGIPSFFSLIPEIKISSLVQKTQIDPALLRQYKSGKANASKKQPKKIEKAFHELGSELLSLKF